MLIGIGGTVYSVMSYDEERQVTLSDKEDGQEDTFGCPMWDEDDQRSDQSLRGPGRMMKDNR